MPLKVGTDCLALIARPDGLKRRLGSSQQDRGGIGTNLGILLGLVFLCLLLRLSPTSNNRIEIVY